MVAIVKRRISRSAIWCRRLALFAMPFFAITILLHRWEAITSAQAMWLVAAGLVILAIAIVLAIRSITQLWNEGAKGGKAMTAGLLLSAIMLAPFAYMTMLAFAFPPINDVATNVRQVPAFAARPALRGGWPTIVGADGGYGEDHALVVLREFPKVGPRRYAAGPERVFEAVAEIVADRGWAVSRVHGLPDDEELEGGPDEEDSSALAAAGDGQLEGARPDDIFVEAVARTAIFAFKNDVVIQIISEEENTLVEMRAASRWGRHDFGENARIIERFMRDLDRSLIGIAGEG